MIAILKYLILLLLKYKIFSARMEAFLTIAMYHHRITLLSNVTHYDENKEMGSRLKESQN